MEIEILFLHKSPYNSWFKNGIQSLLKAMSWCQRERRYRLPYVTLQSIGQAQNIYYKQTILYSSVRLII